METFTREELVELLNAHKGERINLTELDLSELDLSELDLSGTDLSGTDLTGASLRRTDLRHVNLSEANLTDVDLSGAILRRADFTGTVYEDDLPIIINTEFYDLVKTKKSIIIGCQEHTPEEWAKFTDEEISKMDSDALEFWTKYKTLVLLNV